jgi:hypothetical protein
MAILQRLGKIYGQSLRVLAGRSGAHKATFAVPVRGE